MIYYHKYASDSYMEWATTERDDIIETELDDMFYLQDDKYYDGEKYVSEISWRVAKVFREGKYLHVHCTEVDDSCYYYSDDEDSIDDDETNIKDQQCQLEMQIKYKRRLSEYKVKIKKYNKEFICYVCRSDKYPFGKYNPYNGH